MTTPFHYSERDPAPALRPWIKNYWGFAVHPGTDHPLVHHAPPDGCSSLVLLHVPGGAPQALVTGPWLGVLTVPVRPGARYWGFRCLPHTGGRVFRADPALLRDRSQPAAPLIGDLADRLTVATAALTDPDDVARELDRLLVPASSGWRAPEPLSRAAVAAIVAADGECAVAAVAGELDVSPRTLLRHFRASTGITPKQFARIRRFLRAAAALLEPKPFSWAQVAAEAGYVDQAHLANEFADLTGLRPEAFLARLRATTHDNVHP